MAYFTENDDIESGVYLEDGFDRNAYNEACLFQELMQLPYETRVAIAESEEAAVLEAKGMIGRKTIIRLKKDDDITRRTTTAAYQMAKDSNDPLWRKLLFHMEKKNEFKQKIIKKYSQKASRVAKTSQRDYLKSPSSKLLNIKDLAKTREK